jgi:hypothetical protein
VEDFSPSDGAYPGWAVRKGWAISEATPSEHNSPRRGAAAVIPVTCGDQPASPSAAPAKDGFVRLD